LNFSSFSPCIIEDVGGILLVKEVFVVVVFVEEIIAKIILF
jgi:hypothetical protein